MLVLEGIHAGKAHTPVPAVLDNRACEFVPRVQTLAVGQALALHNSDPILHNVHARRHGYETVFNLGLPHWSQKTYRFEHPGHILIDCDVLHTWMRAYVVVTEHPYAVVTNSEGRFRMSKVPPGEYTLRLWHERLGEQRHSCFSPSRSGEPTYILPIQPKRNTIRDSKN